MTQPPSARPIRTCVHKASYVVMSQGSLRKEFVGFASNALTGSHASLVLLLTPSCFVHGLRVKLTGALRRSCHDVSVVVVQCVQELVLRSYKIIYHGA